MKEYKDLNDFFANIHFEQIAIKYLESNQDYQRNVSEAHVKRAVENFDPYQVNPVKVSRRNGRNYVFNGQHTIEIIAEVTGSRDTLVWCMIYDDLEYKHEADIFANQQKYVRQLTAYDIFNAKIESGDEEAHVIKSIVENYNLTLSSNKYPHTICAISTLVYIYEKYGCKILDATIRLCVATWQGENNSLSSYILKAVAIIIQVYQQELNEELFKEKLGLIPINQITRSAKAMQNGTKGFGYAITILNFYNHRLSKPLEVSKLYTQKQTRAKTNELNLFKNYTNET
ncbi:hypothetical protein IKP85_02335 [bacterium]|nr:hypothetical protein [bacterium]MBR6098564.1 hypothetical protein [bacterium]